MIAVGGLRARLSPPANPPLRHIHDDTQDTEHRIATETVLAQQPSWVGGSEAGLGELHDFMCQNLERSLASGVIVDLSGHHQFVRPGSCDKRLQAVSYRLWAADQ